MIPVMNDEADEALAERARRGDTSAYAALVRRWSEALYRLVLRYAGDADEARDMTQEAFVSAWMSLDSFDPARPFGPWLKRIALNKCRDAARRKRVRAFFFRARPIEDALYLASAGPETDDPEIKAIQLEAAIAALPDGLKAPLILCALEGHSHKEAAAMLGLTPKAVELRIARAKQKLTEVLGS